MLLWLCLEPSIQEFHLLFLYHRKQDPCRVFHVTTLNHFFALFTSLSNVRPFPSLNSHQIFVDCRESYRSLRLEDCALFYLLTMIYLLHLSKSLRLAYWRLCLGNLGLFFILQVKWFTLTPNSHNILEFKKKQLLFHVSFPIELQLCVPKTSFLFLWLKQHNSWQCRKQTSHFYSSLLST